MGKKVFCFITAPAIGSLDTGKFGKTSFTWSQCCDDYLRLFSRMWSEKIGVFRFKTEVMVTFLQKQPVFCVHCNTNFLPIFGRNFFLNHATGP
jgi:hypothetical protein